MCAARLATRPASAGKLKEAAKVAKEVARAVARKEAAVEEELHSGRPKVEEKAMLAKGKEERKGREEVREAESMEKERLAKEDLQIRLKLLR